MGSSKFLFFLSLLQFSIVLKSFKETFLLPVTKFTHLSRPIPHLRQIFGRLGMITLLYASYGIKLKIIFHFYTFKLWVLFLILKSEVVPYHLMALICVIQHVNLNIVKMLPLKMVRAGMKYKFVAS